VFADARVPLAFPVSAHPVALGRLVDACVACRLELGSSVLRLAQVNPAYPRISDASTCSLFARSLRPGLDGFVDQR
jgi:hypothetical protein